MKRQVCFFGVLQTRFWLYLNYFVPFTSSFLTFSHKKPGFLAFSFLLTFIRSESLLQNSHNYLLYRKFLRIKKIWMNVLAFECWFQFTNNAWEEGILIQLNLVSSKSKAYGTPASKWLWESDLISRSYKISCK